MNSGFYSLDPMSKRLRYAPNAVRGPNIDLFASEHETYSYPVEGWAWYDTREDAVTALSPEPDQVPEKIKRPKLPQ